MDHSVEFLSFLNLAKNDNQILRNLQNGNHADINNFGGLKAEERELLKTMNWNDMDVQVDEATIAQFSGGQIASRDIACERTVAMSQVSARCVVV